MGDEYLIMHRKMLLMPCADCNGRPTFFTRTYIHHVCEKSRMHDDNKYEPNTVALYYLDVNYLQASAMHFFIIHLYASFILRICYSE